MLSELRNVFPDTAEVNSKGHLVIGGCDVVELAGSKQFGTPVYVFDEDTLRNRCQQFTAEFRKRTRKPPWSTPVRLM